MLLQYKETFGCEFKFSFYSQTPSRELAAQHGPRLGDGRAVAELYLERYVVSKPAGLLN